MGEGNRFNNEKKKKKIGRSKSICKDLKEISHRIQSVEIYFWDSVGLNLPFLFKTLCNPQAQFHFLSKQQQYKKEKNGVISD